MSEKRTTKEKVLAIIFVLFLFFIVGSLLLSISLNNRKNTLKLQAAVAEQEINRLNLEKIASVYIDESTIATTTAESFITLAVLDQDNKKVLLEKKSGQVFPIASVTKLMTAMIVIDKIPLETAVVATKETVGGDGTAFVLEPGKTYLAKDLINGMLISSDNDSAQLLASIIGENNFVDQMNAKAVQLGLTQTSFVNVTGLDPLVGMGPVNLSTVNDLANLMWHIKENYPKIFEITTQLGYNICATDKSCKTVTTTNQLLSDENLKYEIIGGKTGQTILAKKNLALIIKLPNDVSLINIVLGSDDNFQDSLNIINQIKL
ncbi:MAG: serine hydrolase [Candidatus Paceibacterota bacterium]